MSHLFLYRWMAKMWSICTMKHYLTIKKFKNHKICQKVVGPREYSIKLSNPSSERQILHVLLRMWILHFKFYICTFMWNIVWVEARKLRGVHKRGRRHLKGMRAEKIIWYMRYESGKLMEGVEEHKQEWSLERQRRAGWERTNNMVCR